MMVFALKCIVKFYIVCVNKLCNQCITYFFILLRCFRYPCNRKLKLKIKNIPHDEYTWYLRIILHNINLSRCSFC